MYTLIIIFVSSALGLFGMVFYKRIEERRGTTNVSFHHIPIFHVREYSIFLHKIIPPMNRQTMLQALAYLYVHSKYYADNIWVYIKGRQSVKKLNSMVTLIQGKSYAYTPGNKTSEFLKAIAEHKQRMRSQ